MSAQFLGGLVAVTRRSPRRRGVAGLGGQREAVRKRVCALLLVGLAAAGCGRLDREAPGAAGAPAVGGTSALGAAGEPAIGGTSAPGTAGEPATQPGGQAGTSGTGVVPRLTCAITLREAPEPLVEICSSDQVCCSCGCGAADAACGQEQACPPPQGQRCGVDTCREGYVCCNAVCGVCAESLEACAAIPERCQAVGMDPAFERCSDVLRAGVPTKGFGSLEALLLQLHGRWLVCSKPAGGPDDKPAVVAGVDFTSDGRFFLLTRAQDEFRRVDTPDTRGTLSLPGIPHVSEVDFITDVGATISVGLFTADDPRGLWIHGPPPPLTESLAGVYLKDPNTLVE